MKHLLNFFALIKKHLIYHLLLILYIFFSSILRNRIIFSMFIFSKSEAFYRPSLQCNLTSRNCDGIKRPYDTSRALTRYVLREELFLKKCVIGGIVFEWQRVLVSTTCGDASSRHALECAMRFSCHCSR